MIEEKKWWEVDEEMEEQLNQEGEIYTTQVLLLAEYLEGFYYRVAYGKDELDFHKVAIMNAEFLVNVFHIDYIPEN